MNKLPWLISVFVIFSSHVASADAPEAHCAPSAAADPEAALQSQLKALAKPLLTFEQNPLHQMDAGHAVVAYKTKNLSNDIKYFNYGNVSAAEAAKQSQLLNSCIKQPTFGQFNACIAANTSTFSTAEKLLLKQEIGFGFQTGYNYVEDTHHTPQNATCQQVYQNWQTHGTSGGVCREIHTCLNEVSSALKFDQTGVESLDWNAWGTGNASSLHATSLFHDPKTGTYYLQNYSQIYSIQASSFDEASKKAALFLGAFNTNIQEETKPGVVHIEETDLGRWEVERIQAESNLARAGGYDAQIGTDGASFAVRKGLFGAGYSIDSSGFRQTDANLILSTDRTISIKKSQLRVQDLSTAGVSLVQAPSGNYYTPYGQSGIDQTSSPSRSGFNVISEGSLLYQAGSRANPLQYQADYQIHNLQDRGTENANPLFSQFSLGANYQTSRLPGYGTDLHLAQVENGTQPSAMNAYPLALIGRTEIDAVHYLGSHIKVLARYNAYGSLLKPDATGGSMCLYGEEKIWFAAACGTAILSNPSNDPYYTMDHALSSIAAGLHKTWTSKNGSDSTLELSVRHSNGEVPETLDIMNAPITPTGEVGGTSFNLNLSHQVGGH